METMNNGPNNPVPKKKPSDPKPPVKNEGDQISAENKRREDPRGLKGVLIRLINRMIKRLSRFN